MNRHTGSNFDDFLEEHGILEEVSERACKRLLASQLADVMKEEKITKSSLAKRMKTSRSQLDRILDPENPAITIEVLERVALAMGRRLRVELI